MDYNNPNTVDFGDGLILTGFDWQWNSVSYNRGEATTAVQVLMSIPGADYSRNFDIPKPGAWEEIDINTELLKLPEFTGSTLNT